MLDDKSPQEDLFDPLEKYLNNVTIAMRDLHNAMIEDSKILDNAFKQIILAIQAMNKDIIKLSNIIKSKLISK